MDLGLEGKIAIVTGGSKGIGRATALRQRLDPGIDSADFDRQVMALQERVEVTGQRERGSFAPRITVRTHSGEEFSDEFNGDELEWDFATETVRIGELFPQMDWPAAKLNGPGSRRFGHRERGGRGRAHRLLRTGLAKMGSPGKCLTLGRRQQPKFLFTLTPSNGPSTLQDKCRC